MSNDETVIIIVYDNTAFNEGLQADWGFAALVVIEGLPRILFDTGTNGEILLSNMEKLGTDPASIDEVFISHAHLDHTGGLNELIKKNRGLKIWVPPSFGRVGMPGDFTIVNGPTEIHENVYSTGELEGIEQSLCIKTGRGIMVIVGCSHPQMEGILDIASRFGKVFGIIGGLHSTPAKSLKGLDLICPTHCTQQKTAIKNSYPGAYLEGGAGKIIRID